MLLPTSFQPSQPTARVKTAKTTLHNYLQKINIFSRSQRGFYKWQILLVENLCFSDKLNEKKLANYYIIIIEREETVNCWLVD